MSQLREGQPAPLFEGSDQDGNKIKLSDFKGKKVVLFFYPQDDTPSCTTEACNLRDNYEDLLSKGFIVMGVSPDSEKSHRAFIRKFNLPYTLISDPDKKIINMYGAYGEKMLYGKIVTGVLRSTFIIDEDGRIDKIISKVITATHTEQIFGLYNK